MLKDYKNVYNEILNFIEICDYDSAKYLIEKYLSIDKDNVEILDLYAEVLINSDLADDGIKILKRSIELAPDSNGDKYMSLAQLVDYKQSLKYYLKGIEIYKKQVKENLPNNDLNISLANGYAAIAELYMNTNLW